MLQHGCRNMETWKHAKWKKRVTKRNMLYDSIYIQYLEFRKWITKIYTQKSLVFLYTNNEKTEREIKETISFTIATKE